MVATLLYASILAADLPRVVWIGGLEGEDASTRQVRLEASRFRNEKRPKFELIAEPLANPEKETLQFPPTGDAYRQNGASHRIWRWLGTLAPDLVIIAGEDRAGLAQALGAHPVAGIGAIPARAGDLKSVKLPVAVSAAHREVERRQRRTPAETANLLAKVYGNELNEVAYIPAFAVLGRLKLGADVTELVAPYLAGKNSLEKATASHFAGHLLFVELAKRDVKYKPWVEAAAELAERTPMHSEMSDSVFMVCPLLAAAGRGERALEHYRFMAKLDLRPDGLWRHSPLNEAAWGRGNAFALLGLALTLEWLPEGDAQEELLRAFRNLASHVAQQQDAASGMWRQVLDDSRAYPEYSATAMIARAYLIGMKKGWLDTKPYQPRVGRAWMAIQGRTSDQGELVDVCESTGKQKSLEDYLKRKAILGVDARGGAMGLLLAVELAR